jgi:hypothetical protein
MRASPTIGEFPPKKVGTGQSTRSKNLRVSSSFPSSGGIPSRLLTRLLALATFTMLSKGCR